MSLPGVHRKVGGAIAGTADPNCLKGCVIPYGNRKSFCIHINACMIYVIIMSLFKTLPTIIKSNFLKRNTYFLKK